MRLSKHAGDEGTLAPARAARHADPTGIDDVGVLFQHVEDTTDLPGLSREVARRMVRAVVAEEGPILGAAAACGLDGGEGDGGNAARNGHAAEAAVADDGRRRRGRPVHVHGDVERGIRHPAGHLDRDAGVAHGPRDVACGRDRLVTPDERERLLENLFPPAAPLGLGGDARAIHLREGIGELRIGRERADGRHRAHRASSAGVFDLAPRTRAGRAATHARTTSPSTTRAATARRPATGPSAARRRATRSGAVARATAAARTRCASGATARARCPRRRRCPPRLGRRCPPHRGRRCPPHLGRRCPPRGARLAGGTGLPGRPRDPGGAGAAVGSGGPGRAGLSRTATDQAADQENASHCRQLGERKRANS